MSSRRKPVYAFATKAARLIPLHKQVTTISDPRPKLGRDPRAWFAAGFGAGLLPIAPGTFGTLVALPIYGLMQSLSVLSYVGVTVALFFFGVWSAQYAGRRWGVADHQAIVCDEIIGFLITMIAAPSHWLAVLLGFGLFRLFDITKPPPVRQAEMLPGGWGVMTDDVFAGVYAALSLQGILWIMK